VGELLESFDRHCQDRGEASALLSHGEGEKLSFDQLAQRISSWCEKLRQARLPTGSPVAVAVGNGVDFPALFLALLRLGHPMVCVDSSLPSQQRADLCRRLAIPTLLHHAGQSGSTASGAASSIERLTLDLAEPASLPANTILVKMTSGSTSQPAGICLSEAALVAGIRSIGTGMEIDHRDRMLLAIPLSHSYGFDHGVLALAVLGTCLILEAGYFPGTILRTLERDEITFLPTVPPMVKALAESNWPTRLPLRRVISAGGPLLPEFAQRFHRASGHPVHQFYGSTETGGITFETAPLEADAQATVGKPLPGVRVEMESDQTLVVDSPANFLAYLGGDPRARRPVTLADRGEWTASGRLRLTGRTADLLKVGGRRVSIDAVETMLRQVDGIDEAAVVAVDDPVRGDRMVAFVVGDHSPHASTLPPGLLARDVRLIARIPYTPRGKLDRARLRALAAAGVPAEN